MCALVIRHIFSGHTVVSRPFQESCTIRLLLDVPELVWQCLDECHKSDNLIAAAWLLCLGDRLYDDLCLQPTVTDDRRQLIDDVRTALRQSHREL